MNKNKPSAEQLKQAASFVHNFRVAVPMIRKAASNILGYEPRGSEEEVILAEREFLAKVEKRTAEIIADLSVEGFSDEDGSFKSSTAEAICGGFSFREFNLPFEWRQAFGIESRVDLKFTYSIERERGSSKGYCLRLNCQADIRAGSMSKGVAQAMAFANLYSDAVKFAASAEVMLSESFTRVYQAD